MKKIILTIASAAAIFAGVTSCSEKSSNAASGENAALGDSLTEALGQFAGAQASMSFGQAKAMGDSARFAKMNKEDFLRGLKQVLDADTNKLAYYEGLSMGLQLVNPVMGLNNDAGVPIDRAKLIKAFESVFMADSVGDMGQYYAEYQRLMQQAQQIMVKRQQAALAEAPAAKANLADGERYQEKMLKEGYKKSASGLIYKIENPGTGEHATDADMVTVAYTGKLVNGTEFDANSDATFSPTQVVPGFGEAIKMIGVGGKMIAVIPADLGYGVQAPQQIGPNSTLIFTIEVKAIKPSNAAK
ncbi:MAG TPA: hypothetical protein DCR26_01535 [Porphyromonadaceae bacterium]|jgi:FKBP-type peptidyl-prolyl cis-trans isomerase|nr:hypothetical protein ED551_10605 [Muribaculaceae bacterium Isolate-013 (NCI)]HAP28776.1 hypothetical protein [Porphyromonadaceae bacterium]